MQLIQDSSDSRHRVSGIRFRLVTTLFLALLNLAGVSATPEVGKAQCSGMCGDANSDASATSADIDFLLNYLYSEGPAPTEACGDMDDYQLTTVRDVVWGEYWINHFGSDPICPPANGPYVPQPTMNYTINYNRVFPANATSVMLDLDMESLGEIQGMTLPFTILVGGVAPTIGTVSLDPSWTITRVNPNPNGGPAGSIVLGFYTFTNSSHAGHYELADIELLMPISGSNRPITISWTALPPIEAGQPVNYPMVVSDTTSPMNAWEPYLLPAPFGGGSLSGVKFRDDDADCNQGLTEPGLKGFMIYLQPLGWIATTDDTGGYYYNFVPTGTYTLQEVPKKWYTQTCPVSPATYTVVLADGAVETGLDFGNQFQIVQDLGVWVAGSRARPGFEKTYAVYGLNVGSVPVAALCTLYLPNQVTYLSHTGTGSYSPGTHSVVWTLGVLAAGSTAAVTAKVQVLTGTPLGSFICATATINPVLGDADLTNNVNTECQEVRNSWDPNEKHVAPPGAGPNGYVHREDTLRYHIDFQNTGNDTAFTVVIRDTVDQDVDITAIQSGAASDPYTFSISNRELKWTFNNILLPDSIIDEPGSHGFVEYTLRPSAGAPDGAVLPNLAGIYFDFNPPVVTNTVVNTICPVVVAGDVNNNGTVTSADIINLVNYVFKGGVPPEPVVEVGDINCDGVITSADIITLVNYVFKGGPPPCDVCTIL